MDLRDEIAATVDAWANHAHRETYLGDRLHPKARGWLIDHIETMLRKVGVSTVGPVNGPAPVKPVKPAKVIEAVVEKIETATATASTGASEGPATSPAVPDAVPTMEDLKGKLKGQKKGKRA